MDISKNFPSLSGLIQIILSGIVLVYLIFFDGGHSSVPTSVLTIFTFIFLGFGCYMVFKKNHKNPGLLVDLPNADKQKDNGTDARFEAFMQNSPAVAWIKDSTGRYTYINEEFCHKFSLQKSEVIGKTDYDILNHEVVDLITQDDNYVVETGHKKEIYEDVPGPDGIMHHWWVHKFAINANEGEVFLAGIGFDITDKKIAEQGLADSEKRYRLISENMSDLICLHDTNGSYTYISPSVSDILGYHPEELMHKSPYDIINPEDSEHHADKEYFRKMLHSGHTINRYKKKTGQYIWLETISKPIYSENGEIVKHQTISRDITHRKTIENEISTYMENLQILNKELTEARDLAEQSVKIKDEFLANTSHEIRTPMNAIIGLTRLMLESTLSMEHREYLEAIAKSGDTLMTVLNDILDLSKLEAGKMTFEEISFSPKDNIRYTVDLLRPKAKEKNIIFDYAIADDIPRTLVGDPVRLNQVVMNLLSNAIKFTEKGHVSLDLRISETYNKPGFIALCLRVSDTGIGIEQDKIKEIFNTFTQGNSSITRKYGGTGLGLAIVKRLIDLQQGHIEVQSILNEGSRFTITLFYKKVDASAVDRNSDKQIMTNGLANKRGLLVEDNTINQLVAKQVFRDFGMEIEVANNGIEALKCLEKSNFDIVFMDLMMPEMDGFEATKRIREMHLPEKRNIPIIALSASALNSEMEKCFETGMNEYISKPFDTRNLFNKIVKLINKDMTAIGNGVGVNSSERITNLNYLRDLAEGSNSFIEEILTMFIDVIPKNLDELDESLSKNDWENMKLVSHKMKPSYGFVGVKSAEDIMASIEKNVTEMPDRMLLSELLNHAREISVRCVIELKDELAHLEDK